MLATEVDPMGGGTDPTANFIVEAVRLLEPLIFPTASPNSGPKNNWTAGYCITLIRFLDENLHRFTDPSAPLHDLLTSPLERLIKDELGSLILESYQNDQTDPVDLKSFYETNSFCRNPNPEIQKNRINLMLDILGLTGDAKKRIASMISVADEIHQGQSRKTGHPYITHPLGVAATMLRTFVLMSADPSAQQTIQLDEATKRVIEELVIFALFHDTVEDQPDRVIEWVRKHKQLNDSTPLPLSNVYQQILTLIEKEIKQENKNAPSTYTDKLKRFYKQVEAAVLLRHILPIEEKATPELLALTKAPIDSDFFYQKIKPFGKYAGLIKVFDRLNNLEEYIGFKPNKIPINVLTSIAYILRDSDASGAVSSTPDNKEDLIPKLTKLCKQYLSQRVEQLYLTALGHFQSEYLENEGTLTESQLAFKNDNKGPEKMLAYLKSKADKLHSQNQTLGTPEALIYDFIAEVYGRFEIYNNS